MFDSMTTLVSDLAKRLGVRPASTVRSSLEGLLPLPSHMTPLLEGGGIRRGSTVNVVGSLAVVAMVMAEVTRAGLWCAVLDVPALSATAAARAGVDLAHCVFVATGAQMAAAAATLIGGVDLVVLGEPSRLSAVSLRKLAARARQSGTVLLGTGSWPSADVQWELTGSAWSGLADGYGQLTSRTVQLHSSGRRVPRPRQARMTVGVDGRP